MPDLWFAGDNRVGGFSDWDSAGPRRRTRPLGQRGKGLKPSHVVVSPCGQCVASNGKFGSVVWDAVGEAKFARPHPARSHNGPLAFSPDSDTLALAHGNKVTLWDFATDSTPLELVGHKYAVWGVGFSPDGIQVHTVSSDGTQRTFDAETGRPLRALDFGLGAMYAAAFSPDGLMGAAGSADGRVVVFDLGE